MMKHIWSVLCQRSVIDSETNNLSIYDTLEELNVGIKIPAHQPGVNLDTEITIPLTYEVVSFWTRDDATKTMNPLLLIELTDPTGKKLRTFEHKMEFAQNSKRLRSRAKITGIGLTVPGTYKFIIGFKEDQKGTAKQVAELPLDVIIAKDHEPLNKKPV